MNAFKSVKSFSKPISKELFEKILVLPSNINLKKKDIQFFKKKIDFFLNSK